LRYSVTAWGAGAAGEGREPQPGRESVAVAFEPPPPVDAFLDECLSVGGRKFARGIGVRAPARLDYGLDGVYETFRAEVGADDACLFQGGVVFAVEVDGMERYRSPRMEAGAADPVSVRVPVGGAQLLSLIVMKAGDGADADLAVWGEARVLVEKEESEVSK
jgi:hypothetical protein